MELNDQQRNEINSLIQKARQAEYKEFNATVTNAVEELKNGIKSEEEAYNKIFKKVVKNERHLIKRYADLDDVKAMNTLAEVFSDNKVEMLDFENLDEPIKNEVYRISGIIQK